MPIAAPMTYSVGLPPGTGATSTLSICCSPSRSTVYDNGSDRVALTERALHFLDGLDRRAVDGDEHIARTDACRHRTAARGDVGGGDPFRTRFPEHAVLELVRRRAYGDIQRAKAQQDTHQGK